MYVNEVTVDMGEPGEKAVRLMSFSDKDAPSSPIFKDLNILKLNDLITTNNIIFVHKTLNKLTPSHFGNYFELHAPSHNHATRNNPSSGYSLPPGSVSVDNIPMDSLKYNCARDWNDMLKEISRTNRTLRPLLEMSIISLKKISKAQLTDAY